MLILFLVQILILFELFTKFKEYLNSFIYGGFAIINAVIYVYIINKKGNANFKISWLIIIGLLPIFGIAFYIYTNLEIGARIAKNTLIKINENTKLLLEQKKEVLLEIARLDRDVLRIANYMNNTSYYPIYKNTKTQYYPTGESFFDSVLNELEKAKKFIFLEFFIVKNGYMLDKIEEILIRKAREGVEVRFMYDGMVSISHMSESYIGYLKENGIQAKQFLPLNILLSTVYNNRDHRKILVIDGNVAFTGGVNISDEYINKINRFGHWKDNAIKIEGEAVKSFTLMFLQMWSFDNTNQEYTKYLDECKSIYDNSKGYVLPYADSPLDGERVGENIYLDIISNAKEYVYITTPYLILDDNMLETLSFAAKSGIDIRIITPHIPDKKYVYILAKTYQRELIESGVKIYEYTPGFIHSKIFISDNIKATIGTVNLDYRSLYLNFECGVYLYETDSIEDIKKDFNETLSKSHEIKLADLENISIIHKIFGRFILRFLAPLL